MLVNALRGPLSLYVCLPVLFCLLYVCENRVKSLTSCSSLLLGAEVCVRTGSCVAIVTKPQFLLPTLDYKEKIIVCLNNYEHT
jgi:hypothetical protein